MTTYNRLLSVFEVIRDLPNTNTAIILQLVETAMVAGFEGKITPRECARLVGACFALHEAVIIEALPICSDSVQSA